LLHSSMVHERHITHEYPHAYEATRFFEMTRERACNGHRDTIPRRWIRVFPPVPASPIHGSGYLQSAEPRKGISGLKSADRSFGCKPQVIKNLCSDKWIRRKSWPKVTRRAPLIRLADLFSGCGGLSLGAFEAARTNHRKLKVVLAVDLDKAAIGVYRANFGVGPRIARADDVSLLFARRLQSRLTAREKKLRKACGRVDLLIAGPPCQGHSDLNNRSRRSDPRNSLYLRVVRATKILQPQAVIIENVPGAIHDKGRVVARARNGLEKLGYRVSTEVIEAHAIGLAQKRRRHILVGVKGGAEFDFTFLKGLRPEKTSTVRDYIGDLTQLNGSRHPLFDEASNMSQQNKTRARFLYRGHKYDLPDYLRPKCHRDFVHSYLSMYGRLRWTKPAQTITSGFGSMGQGRFLHPSSCRTLTPHEAARLQGFPDFFRFTTIASRTSLQTTIGNAVPPRLAAIFVDRLIGLGHL
jgi:DNA (cytosine-5)-methyltransferase 1